MESVLIVKYKYKYKYRYTIVVPIIRYHHRYHFTSVVDIQLNNESRKLVHSAYRLKPNFVLHFIQYRNVASRTATTPYTTIAFIVYSKHFRSDLPLSDELFASGTGTLPSDEYAVSLSHCWHELHPQPAPRSPFEQGLSTYRKTEITKHPAPAEVGCPARGGRLFRRALPPAPLAVEMLDADG